MKSKRKKGKKAVILICTLALVLAASVIAIPKIAEAANTGTTTQNSTTTKTATVSTQNIEKDVTGTGQVVTGDEEVQTLASKYIDEVLVEEGQAVNAGDPLVRYTNNKTLDAAVDGVVKTITIADSALSGDRRASDTDSFTIMSTDNLETQITVNESDLQNIQVGQDAQVTLNAMPDASYTGKVTNISQTGTYSNGSSTFTVTIKLDQTADVKIGMSADVKIVVSSAADAMAVPIEAVIGSGDNAKVMVVGTDGTASPVSVTLGLANDAYVQITSGLTVGQTIQYTTKSADTSKTAGNFGGMGLTGSGSFDASKAFGGGGMQNSSGQRPQMSSGS